MDNDKEDTLIRFQRQEAIAEWVVAQVHRAVQVHEVFMQCQSYFEIE